MLNTNPNEAKQTFDLTAKLNEGSWQLNFSFPGNIEADYSLDLTTDKNQSITDSENQIPLQDGQLFNPTFIVQDNGSLTIIPQFNAVTEPKNSGQQTNQTPQVTSEESSKNSISPTNNPIMNESVETTINQANNNGKTIDVDRDFAGNLEEAIAVAQDGDLVKLGGNKYYTDGLTINKNITIDGQEGTIIDGNGTSASILSLTAGAKGAVIQDLAITNGNNGIVVVDAANITLNNLNIHHIGLDQTMRDGANNTGVILDHASDFKLLNSTIQDIGRKGVGVIDTDGGLIKNITVQNINLDAQHAQSHDAAGVKFFNTNDIVVQDSHFSDINAIAIWNDLSNLTTIANNQVENIGEDFLAPAFNNYVDIIGIYNEKSSNAVIKQNEVTSVGEFTAFRATEFATETMTIEDNDFSNYQLGTTDYWVNESAEKLVAITPNPDEANFNLFADDYLNQANIGD